MTRTWVAVQRLARAGRQSSVPSERTSRAMTGMSPIGRLPGTTDSTETVRHLEPGGSGWGHGHEHLTGGGHDPQGG